MTIVMAFLAVALLGLVPACTNVQTFPQNGTPAISQQSEFGTITAQPDTYKGRAVRLAGRIIGVKETDTGTLLLAKWLPFPEYTGDYYGDVPGDPSDGTHDYKFSVLYPGKLDESARWLGNEFLATGEMKGQRRIVTLTGRTQNVPDLQAECLRIWKTAGDRSVWNDPTGMDRNLPIAETYCQKS